MTTALTSKLWFEADYKADGKVLLLPVKGSGKCNVTLCKLNTHIIIIIIIDYSFRQLNVEKLIN